MIKTRYYYVGESDLILINSISQYYPTEECFCVPGECMCPALYLKFIYMGFGLFFA